MAHNSLSPGFIRITYTGLNGPHHIMLPTLPVGTITPGDEPDIQTKGSGAVPLTTAVADFIAAYGTLFNDDTLFGLCEMYLVSSIDENRQFVYSFDIGETGSAGGANVEFSMATITYKTTLGGLARIVAMEGTAPVDLKRYPPFNPISAEGVFTTYVLGADSIIVGRDGNFAFTPISFSTKASDALRAKAGL